MGTARSWTKAVRYFAFVTCCTIMWSTSGSAAKAESNLQDAASASIKNKETNTTRTTAVTAATIRYVPPFRGAPARRIGGATRNVKSDVDYLAVIAPIESGLTIRSMPNLYWYLLEGTQATVEVTVLRPNEIEPRIEIRIPGPVSSGVHRLSLNEGGIELEVGVEYEWHVAVILDTLERSADIVSSGTVVRTQLSPEQSSRIAGKSGLESATILAAEGIWYDAVDDLFSALEHNRSDHELRQALIALLRQVDLDRIAADY